MATNSKHEEKVDVEFGSHPPIQEDLDGIATLLRQTLLHYADCNSLAQYLIELKDITQIIALENADDEEDSDDEADNDIYGVSSFIDLTNISPDHPQHEARKQLRKFLMDKCPSLRKMMEVEENRPKICVVVNERYMNLPPQLSLPTLKDLTKYLDKSDFTHFVFVSKVLLRSRNSETQLPSKKPKTSTSSTQDSEPIIFVNAEEEIICENSDHTIDLDVSAHCDDNASWSSKSDVKYIPHRRIMVVNKVNWPKTLEALEKELC